MKIETTKEKVLEAASKCSQAKETLKILFPDVFKGPEIEYDGSKIYAFKSNGDVYKLTRTENGYVFADLSTSECWANGCASAEKMLSYSKRGLHVFNNRKEFANWLASVS